MYASINELLNLAEAKSVPLWRIILENEMALSEKTEEEVFERLATSYDVMKKSASQALKEGFSSFNFMIDGFASMQYDHASSEQNICGGLVNQIMARAFSSSEVNSAMGKICAAPTAGSCGILPAVLITVGEKFQCNERQILEALLTASGMGAVVVKNATVAGSEGGCQAECGVAGAIAAAAAVQLAGGSNFMMIQAFSFALINCMGLVCDPIAGLVQMPCAQRNASQAINAVLSADMALSGQNCVIPADEVVEAMYRVGRMLPFQLRETAMGGVAATPTGEAIKEKLRQQSQM